MKSAVSQIDLVFLFRVSHFQNQQRQQRRSFEMLATSTHDTKRSEDVRARLCVLSEIPKLWEQKTTQWARQNRSRKTTIDDEQMPDANDEYLIYQTLVGACPLETTGTDWVESFKKRVTEYMLKAARESKSHTSWINQNARLRKCAHFVYRKNSDDPLRPIHSLMISSSFNRLWRIWG